MVIFLFFLSLLIVISCDNTHQSPCDVFTIDSKPPKKLTPKCKHNPCELKYIDHVFSCPNNETFIYLPNVPEGPDTYKIELISIKCNVKTSLWEAMEKFNDLIVKRDIYLEGNLMCKGDLKLTCSETRLDYNEHIDELKVDDPVFLKSNVKKYHKYECKDSSKIFFYTAKFALHPKEGLYLLESPECTDSKLTARFTSKEEPVEISYLGSITCKTFLCSDSNDASYTWPLILRINSDCKSFSECQPPDWYNEKFPCGEDGKEMVVYRLVNGKQQWIWLKDHYFQCDNENKILIKDSDGKSRELKMDDTILCRKPFSCEPLMSDPSELYGCKNRSNCADIDPGLIPSFHLSSFDGRCYKNDHVLKIAREGTSIAIGMEIDFISCKYGKWILTPAEGSIVNEWAESDEIINKQTNFVCEGRVDHFSCDEPISDCDGSNSVTTMCKPAQMEPNGNFLRCEEGMSLVLRTKYENGFEEVKAIDGKVICDKKTGKWISLEPPFIEVKDGINKASIRWQSFIVCAANSCTPDVPSECQNDAACTMVKSPKYWLNATCDHPKLLFYSENKQRAPATISSLYCNASLSVEGSKTQWMFKINDQSKRANAEDNFYCREEYIDKVVKTAPIMEDTSPECNPTRLDSICHYDIDICTPVIKNDKPFEEEAVTFWECDPKEKRTLWYYETGSKNRDQLDRLYCSPKGIFWKAHKAKNNPENVSFTPPPHSNIVCLSIDSKDEPKAESNRRSLQHRSTPAKPWKWKMSVPESIAIFTSLLIFALSLALFLWARRKYYKEIRRNDHSVEDH